MPEPKKYNFGLDELLDSSTENEYGWKIKTDPNSVYQPDLIKLERTKPNPIQDIIKASREQNFVSPQIQQTELGQPRSREVDPVTKQVLKTLLSIPTSSVEGMRGAGDLFQESIKGFKEGDILGGALGTGASLLRAGFSAATPVVPMLRAFTMGTDIAGDVIGQENLEPIMTPITHFTKPESLAGRSGAEIADLIAQLLIAKGGENAFKLGKSKLGKKDFEVPFPEGEKTTPQFQVKENEPKPIEGLTQEKNIIQDYIKKEAFKQDNNLQAKIMTEAGIPEADMPNYALSSVADGKILRSYVNEIKQGKITEQEAIERVKNDYEKMKSGEKEGKFIEEEKPKEKPQIIKVKDFKTEEGKFSVYNEKGYDGRQGDRFTVFKDKDGYIVRNALLPDGMKRKGIATDFYKRMNEESIKQTGKPLRSTQERTISTGQKFHELSNDAIALWDSFVKKGLAEKISEKNYRFNPPKEKLTEQPLTKAGEGEVNKVYQSPIKEESGISISAPKEKQLFNRDVEIDGQKPSKVLQGELTTDEMFLRAISKRGNEMERIREVEKLVNRHPAQIQRMLMAIRGKKVPLSRSTMGDLKQEYLKYVEDYRKNPRQQSPPPNKAVEKQPYESFDNWLKDVEIRQSGKDMQVYSPSGKKYLAPNTNSKAKALEINKKLLQEEFERDYPDLKPIGEKTPFDMTEDYSDFLNAKNIKERIYNNLQWDKNDTPTKKRALLKQAQNDAKLLREQGINADIKRGAGNKWKLVIDNKPQGKRELGLVTKTEKVKLEDVEIENPNAKKPYSELGEGKKKEQQIVAETFVEASDLPSGLGEKTLKKGIEDIKNNDGAEQSKEAQLIREVAEDVLKDGKEIKIGAGSSETEFISPKQVKEFVKEKEVKTELPIEEEPFDLTAPETKGKKGKPQQIEMEGLGAPSMKGADDYLKPKGKGEETTPLFEQKNEAKGQSDIFDEDLGYTTKHPFATSGTDKLSFDNIVREDLNVKSFKDERRRVDRYVVEYKDAEGEVYTKSFEVEKGTKFSPPKEGTHDTLEKIKYSRKQGGNLASYASQGTKELQTQPKVMSEFKGSDLNDVTRLRDIGRNMTKDIGLAEGKDVRTGRKIMRRFGKMLGFYSPSTGIVRIKNMNDIGVLAHELGHKLDFEVFPETQNLRFKKGDKLEQTITLVSGYKNAQRKAKVLDTLRKKHGQAAVDSILERAELRAELKKFGGSIGKYFEKTEESIAEFISRYVTNPEEVRTKAPRFYNLFENILDQNPNIRKTLITAREQVAKFRSQDPRQITESTIARDDVTDSFLSKIKDAFDGGFFYNIVDGTKPLRDLVQKLEEKGTNIAGKDNPLLQTLSLIGVDGKAKQFLENHPFIKSGNDVKILTDKKPFFEIFKRMLHEGSLKEHEGYLTALRNIELYKNKKGQAATTTLDIAEKTKSLYEKQLGKDYLDNLTKDLRDYNQALLDYYQQSGKISPEILNSIKELNQYYVPFKRFFEEFENTGQAPNVSKYIKDSSPSPVKQIRGSQREIISPIGSIIKNTYDMIAAADRNTALKTIIESLRKVDKTLVQEIPPRTFKPVEVIREKKVLDADTGEMELNESGGFTETKVGVFYEKPQGESVVTVWYDGKPKYYQIPKEYYDSFFSISDPVSKAIQTLSAPSRLLQAGAVVYDPTFAVRNIPRDQVSALFYSKYGYQPIDIVKGLFSAVKKTEAYQKFLASGADQSFLTAMDQMLTKNYMQERTGRRVQTTFQKYKRNPVEILRDLNRATELGTRVGAFKKAYLKSGDVWRAMQEGREITADYGVKGKMMTNVSPLLPFFNARIQHAKRTAQSLKQRPTQSLAKGIAFISAPSIINWFANNTDEDRRKLYNELPLWRKYGFFNIPIPGTQSFLPLPKGFFGQLFGTSMEGALDWALNNEPETIKDLAGQLFQETSPLSSPIDFIPQFGRPIVEQFANKKGYTGAPIVSERLKGLDAEDQYTDATSEFAKYVGGVIGLSPARIDAFITGYTAGAGRGILNVSDEVLELTGIVDGPGEDTFTRLSRMPILKAFITETPLGTRGLSVEKFYSKLDELESLNKTVNNYIKDDNVEKLDEYLIGKEDDYIYYLNNQTEINKFKDVLRAVRDLRYQIYKDPKISDKRETIRKMEQEVTDVAIKFSESYENKQKFNLSTTLKEILKNKKLADKTKKKEIKKFKSIYDED